MHARESSQPRTPWLWISAVWLAIGLVNATQTVIGLRAEGIQRPMGIFFVVNVLTWLPWTLATPMVLRLAQRFPPSAPARLRGWAEHLAAYLGITLALSIWITGLQVVIHPWGPPTRPQPFYRSLGSRFRNELFVDLLVYAATVAIGFTLESRRRLALRETQLSEARLSALRRQLEPHFLFNTLNAISGLVRDQRNDAAVEMIAGLSDLLRRVVEDGGRQEVPLGEELEFLERYLEIQRMRFIDRLRVSVDVPQELYTAQVPSLILQPMVENALQHGIGKLVEGGAIRIAASHNGHSLTLSVHNDGPPLAANWNPDGAGVGISNTRARIQSLYGSDCALALRNHAAGGVEALVTLPYRTAP